MPPESRKICMASRPWKRSRTSGGAWAAASAACRCACVSRSVIGVRSAIGSASQPSARASSVAGSGAAATMRKPPPAVIASAPRRPAVASGRRSAASIAITSAERLALKSAASSRMACSGSSLASRWSWSSTKEQKVGASMSPAPSVTLRSVRRSRCASTRSSIDLPMPGGPTSSVASARSTTTRCSRSASDSSVAGRGR
jgi:hypothetical protein